jgi:hypothetical protein
MKCRIRTITVIVVGLLASIGHAQTVRRWDFNRIDDREGWEVRPGARGVVMGGALWLTVASTAEKSARFNEGIGNPVRFDPVMLSNIASSPQGLNIPAAQVTQVRLRILNLSPVTDFFLRWRAVGQEWEMPRGIGVPPPQSTHCSLKMDLKKWQEVTCYLDAGAQGIIDQIGIQLPIFSPPFRGDLWIDWIEVGRGPPKPVQPRPDVASVRVIPQIQIPHLSQSGFADAFKVLDECLIVDVPNQGFNYPYMGPGGYYGDLWHVLDTSMTLNGAKWANQSFAEGVMRGFREVQAEEPSGRIPGAGYRGERGQPADWSQTPRFFEVAYDIARRTNNAILRAEIYDTMRGYLDWWLGPERRDAKTGLVMAFGDDFDTLSEEVGWTYPPAVAAVDLNMAVAIGADRVARLAAALGWMDEATRYRQVFQDLSRDINSTLWDDKDGVYYNQDLSTGKARRRVLASTFEPLRFGIASAAQRDRLINRLTDPGEFNWGKIPLTTVAMTDTAYAEAKGNYTYSAWNGDVWTYRNLEAIKGLEDAGRPDLAAELNWATIKEFHENYHEYLLPSTGAGQGTNRYGWTASQYIEAIIEHLFGVDFDALEHRVRIAPHVPQELYGQDIGLSGLILPTGGDTRLSVHIYQTSRSAATIRIEITGALPRGDLVVALPGSGKENRVSMRHTLTATFR